MHNNITNKIFRKIELEDCKWSYDEIEFYNKYFANCRVIIPGGNGILGSAIIRTLAYANEKFNLNIIIESISRSGSSEKVSIIDSKPYFVNTKSNLIDFKFKKDERPIVVIHCASQASPIFYKTDPVGTIMPNMIGTYNLLNQLKDKNCKSFVFISAGEIYGKYEKGFVDEQSYGPLDPFTLRSCYAESKRSGEILCNAFYNQFKIPTKVIRLFHTYGIGMSLDDGRVFADFVKNALEEKKIVMNSDGEAVRCFCYLSDAISGILKVTCKGIENNAYNLANVDQEISIKNLALIIDECSGNNLGIKFNSQESNKSYLKSPFKRLTPKIEKIKQLGWEPKVSAFEGFKRTIEWYRKKKLNL